MTFYSLYLRFLSIGALKKFDFDGLDRVFFMFLAVGFLKPFHVCGYVIYYKLGHFGQHFLGYFYAPPPLETLITYI
jgi:hypothetical protein